MPRRVRVTILQPDPAVPADRLGPWLAAGSVAARTVPLWSAPVPPATGLGDGLVVLGGVTSAHGADPWLGPLREVLAAAVAAGVPTLAVCLGHQVLAEALGGRVTVGAAGLGEHGACEVVWRPAAVGDPVVGALAEAGRSLVAESHDDAVTELPPGAVPLASGEACPVQAFRVGPALGVQFHPEASPHLMARWAALGGRDGEAVRLAMAARDGEVSRAGRLLVAGFCAQVRAAAV